MMYKHLSGKKLAEEILAETLGHYQEFSDDINFFEKMLEMRRKDMGFDWVYNNDFDESMEEEIFFENFDFYMRIMDDMLQYYEDRFVGDDDLGVISEIIDWAIDNQEDNKSVEKMLTEVLTFLNERNVDVNLENGSVVKTMGEVIDTYLISGFEGRHPEQMSRAQLMNDSEPATEMLEVLQGERYFIKKDEVIEINPREKNCIIENEEVIEINLVNPLLYFNGNFGTLEKLSRVIGFSADDYRVLIANGFSSDRALEICFLEATLQREIVAMWNAWLLAGVQKFTEIKKLRRMKVYETYDVTCGNDVSSEGSYVNGKIADNQFEQCGINEPLRYRVGNEIGTVKFWAQRKGVSTTWIRVRLQAGLSMRKIMEEVISGPPNWEMWKIQRPDQLHPDRKVITVLDVMNKEQVSKLEIVNEIGSGRFGKQDILKAIKRIKAKRSNEKIGGVEKEWE